MKDFTALEINEYIREAQNLAEELVEKLDIIIVKTEDLESHAEPGAKVD